MTKAKKTTQTQDQIPPTSVVPDVPFARIIANGMTRIIHDILLSVQVAQKGITPSTSDCLDTKLKDKAIIISLRVDRDDVRLPLFLRKSLNTQRSLFLTVILDNYFRDLVVHPDHFDVTLHFQQEHGRSIYAGISVPYSAVSMVRIGQSRLDFVPFMPDDAQSDKGVVAGASEEAAEVESGK